MISAVLPDEAVAAAAGLPHMISLGAGVQSSTMALMAKHGEIKPMPTCAIFADTQAEPQSVYAWLDWLEKQLPFPVYRVTKGDLAATTLKMKRTKDGRAYSETNIPFFVRNHDGSEGKITLRGCTRDYKIYPVRRLQRRLAKIKRGQKTPGLISWVGISLDEIMRVKESRDPWCQNRWPLIELRMHRADCLHWMEEHGYPKPPRSACVFCPFHNDTEWRRLKNDEPLEFAKAVRFERELQQGKAASENFRTTPFLHRKLIPIDQIDFSTEEERGQLNMFNNECEGMCGV